MTSRGWGLGAQGWPETRLALVVLLLSAACGGPTRDRITPASGGPLTPIDAQRPTIVAFGDGVTAGVGLLEAQTWPSQLQARLDELGYDLGVVTAGVPGDTTATALRRIDEALQGEVRILVIAVGAEDARRGVPAATMKQNLAEMIERAHERGVAVLLVGATAPPDFGEQYVAGVARAFQDLARQYGLVFVPALLEGVEGHHELMQADGVNPNAEGARIVCERVWRALQPMVDAIAIGNQAILCQKDALPCALGAIDTDIALTRRLGAGFVGRAKFVLGAMTGPSRLWLQTLPFSRLADRIHHAYRRDVEDTKRDFGGCSAAWGT